MKRSLLCLLAVFLVAPPFSQAAIPGMDSLTDLIEEQFDSNGDGKIDKAEWDKGTTKAFNIIDADRDGVLTATELEGVSTPLAKELGDFAASFVSILVKQVILTFDTDGSGTVSTTEYGEQSSKMREKIDVDKDGDISRSELAEFPSKLLPE